MQTIVQAKQSIPAHVQRMSSMLQGIGYHVCEGASWWTEQTAVVSSVEITRGTYGHPRCIIQWSADYPGHVDVIGYGSRQTIPL